MTTPNVNDYEAEMTGQGQPQEANVTDGSTPDVTSPVDTVEQAGGATQNTNQAPWANELAELPESVRPLVEPIFRKWDANVTKRLQAAHSEYEPYKDYISNYEPDALAQAVQLAEALDTNPQQVYEALRQMFDSEQGQQSQQGAPAQQQTPAANADESESLNELGFDDNHPLVKQLKQQEQLLLAVAQKLQAEEQAEREAAADKQLQETLSGLKATHGDFDEQFVLTQIANGVKPDDAVKAFQTAVQAYAAKLNQPNADAPTVIGSGGGFPAQTLDASKLSEKDTKSLIVQMLTAANQQQQP